MTDLSSSPNAPADLMAGDVLRRRRDGRVFRCQSPGNQPHAPERFWIITLDGKTDQAAYSDMEFVCRPGTWTPHEGGENPLGDMIVEVRLVTGAVTMKRADHFPAVAWTNLITHFRIPLPSSAEAASPEQREIERLTALLNTPEVEDFAKGVVSEAQHQRARWGVKGDAGKSPFDWFWLVGYLAQKAAASAVAGDTEKALHHTISTAAALANWHAFLSGQHTAMRPGIEPPSQEIAA